MNADVPAKIESDVFEVITPETAPYFWAEIHKRAEVVACDAIFKHADVERDIFGNLSSKKVDALLIAIATEIVLNPAKINGLTTGKQTADTPDIIPTVRYNLFMFKIIVIGLKFSFF